MEEIYVEIFLMTKKRKEKLKEYAKNYYKKLKANGFLTSIKDPKIQKCENWEKLILKNTNSIQQIFH